MPFTVDTSIYRPPQVEQPDFTGTLARTMQLGAQLDQRRQQTENERLEAEKRRKQIADDMALQNALRDSTGPDGVPDYDKAVNQLTPIAPHVANWLTDQVQKHREATSKQMTTDLDNQSKLFGSVAQLMKPIAELVPGEWDGTGQNPRTDPVRLERASRLYQAARGEIVRMVPQAAQFLKPDYSPDDVDGIVTLTKDSAAAIAARQQALAESKAAQDLREAPTKRVESGVKSLGIWLGRGGIHDQAGWDQVLQAARSPQIGILEAAIALFPKQYSPEAVQTARELAGEKPEKKAPLQDRFVRNAKGQDVLGAFDPEKGTMTEVPGGFRPIPPKASETGEMTASGRAVAERWRQDEYTRLRHPSPVPKQEQYPVEADYMAALNAWNKEPLKPIESIPQNDMLRIENSYRRQVGEGEIRPGGGMEPPPASTKPRQDRQVPTKADHKATDSGPSGGKKPMTAVKATTYMRGQLHRDPTPAELAKFMERYPVDPEP